MTSRKIPVISERKRPRQARSWRHGVCLFEKREFLRSHADADP